jgi:Rrf2 family protein
MTRSGKLSSALHVLLHMAAQEGRPMTSEQMAVCAGTNPVVIRRTFAGLRTAGIVTSVKGHGGGWSLGRPARKITLGEIAEILGERVVTMKGPEPMVRCLVERAVNEALEGAVQEAQRVLNARLARITLASLAAQVGPQMAAHLAAHSAPTAGRKPRGH